MHEWGSQVMQDRCYSDECWWMCLGHWHACVTPSEGISPWVSSRWPSRCGFHGRKGTRRQLESRGPQRAPPSARTAALVSNTAAPWRVSLKRTCCRLPAITTHSLKGGDRAVHSGFKRTLPPTSHRQPSQSSQHQSSLPYCCCAFDTYEWNDFHPSIHLYLSWAGGRGSTEHKAGEHPGRVIWGNSSNFMPADEEAMTAAPAALLARSTYKEPTDRVTSGITISQAL